MPGIFGILTPTINTIPETLADEMPGRLQHGENWFTAKCLRHQSGFHGVVDFEHRLEDSYASTNDKSLVIYGDVYSCDKYGTLMLSKAEALLYLYENDGPSFISQLNGSFVISILDEQKDELIVANDRLGSKELFYIKDQDGLRYSSEIKALLVEPSIKPKLNSEAVAEFFTFSHLLDSKTLFQGVELLPPASILRYDCGTSQLQIETYWDFEFDRDEEPENIETYLEEFESLMEKAVGRRMEDKSKIGIFLSGGLDSRLMAGFAKRTADKTNKKLISFTFGTRGGWQEKIAAQVASALQIENRFYEIPSDSIAKYAEEIVYKGDGHIRIRDAHFISLLRKVRSEVDTVLVGLFCSELFGEELFETILGVSTKDELIDYLFNFYRIKQIAEHIPGLFATTFGTDLEKRARANFTNILEVISLRSYSEMADYYELRQRDRRYIIPISNYMSWYLDTRLPYLDNEVVDFAVNLPVELRFGKGLIHKASRHIFANIAHIPWEKSGVAPDTTGLPLMLSQTGRAANRRLRKIVERISFGRSLFRPEDYRAYDYLLRTGSRKYIEDVLLRESNQNIFDQGYVRKIVEEHMNGRRNHDQVICDLINMYLLGNIFLRSTK